MIQTITAQQPLFIDSAINNLPVIRFDGNNDNLRLFLTDTLHQPFTMFILWRVFEQKAQTVFDNINDPEVFVFGFPYNAFPWLRMYAGAPGGYSIMYSKEAPFNFIISTLYFTTNAKLFENGQIVGSGFIGNNSIKNLIFGNRIYLDRGLNGDIAEIIIYSTELTSSEREHIETYLMNKYAPPVHLGPDTIILQTFCPYQLQVNPSYQTILWSTGETHHTIYVTSSGSYWVQVTDIFNRISRDTVFIQFPSFQLSDTTICFGDAIQVHSPISSPSYSLLWSTGETTQSISISNGGTYWLRVTDSLLCHRTDTFHIYVDVFPLHASLGSDTSLCRNAPLGLVHGASEAVSYLWSTGDSTAVIYVDTAGTYSVTVTNARGCIATDTIIVSIKGQQPYAGFIANASCFGSPTVLIDTSWTIPPDNILQRQWIIYQDTFQAQQVQYIFSSAGYHPVTLMLTTDSGCTALVTQNVFVIPNPQAAFMPFQGCSGQPIQMTNQTTVSYGSIQSWQWWALDSSQQVIFSSNATHPVITFDHPGNYQLYLVAVTTDNCRDTLARTITIRRTPPVDFTWEQVCHGYPTIFRETTDVPPHEMIIQRQWHFGANNFAYVPITTFQFTQPGIYNVSLFNKSINGCENTITKQVTIYPEPQAQFSTSQTCINRPVEFINTSTAPQSSIASVLWHFPWNDTTSIFSPIVLFPDTGKFPVSLTIFTEQECFDTFLDTIIIRPAPVAQFTMSEQYGTPPLSVQFYNQSLGATGWIWNFGDGTTSTQQHPSHLYEQENIYTIGLIALNQWGCADTTYQVLYVIPTILDLAITGLQLIDTLSFYRVQTQIANLGTRLIRQCQLWLKIDDIIPFVEMYELTLHPGDRKTMTLTSMLDKSSLSSYKTLCVQALPYGQINLDTQPANNIYCISLTNQTHLLPVYFSPEYNIINVPIISSMNQKAEIKIFNIPGQQVTTSADIFINDGYNLFSLDAASLPNGIYHIVITSEQATLNQSFAIIR